MAEMFKRERFEWLIARLSAKVYVDESGVHFANETECLDLWSRAVILCDGDYHKVFENVSNMRNRIPA